VGEELRNISLDEVNQWRESISMMLPERPDEDIEQVNATAVYPLVDSKLQR
jgi:hypothetical protein